MISQVDGVNVEKITECHDKLRAAMVGACNQLFYSVHSKK
jgi:hypothetical protein